MTITLCAITYLLTYSHCIALGSIHFQFDSCDRQVTTHNSRSAEQIGRSDWIPYHPILGPHVRFFIYATVLRWRCVAGRWGKGEWQGLMPDTIHCDAKYFGFDGQWNFAAKKKEDSRTEWCCWRGGGGWSVALWLLLP